MKNKRFKGLFGIMTTSLTTALAVGSFFPITALAAGYTGWKEENGVKFWYENDVKQGTEGRGKEIYDPGSQAWYWLDSIDGGRMAVGKDVYQESLAGKWGDYVGEDGQRYGKWVRYDENGHMIKGWNTDDNGTYYFDLIYGTMAKGNTVIDGLPCSFDIQTGIGANKVWITIDGVEYWYENGVRQGYDPDNADYRGKEIYDPASDAWYWLDNVDQGKKAAGKDVYQESEAGQWAENADGTGKWVRYDENGHMIKGWSEKDGNKYYFDPVYGTMAKGNVEIDGVPYYFNEVTGICEGVAKVSYGVGTEYHTREEVINYMNNSGASINNMTEYDTAASFATPYSPGTLKQDSLNAALAMFNQIRYIAGLDYHVTLNEEYNELAQAGAFVNAVNGGLSHYPAQPSGMSDDLYKKASTGAGSSNIAYTSWKTSFSYACLMWMDDSDASNIDRVGHRRWILNPSMKETGFGYAQKSSGATYTAMYAFDRYWEKTDVYGVAWPAREMPMEYFDSTIAWSYSYGSSLSDVSVKLDCLTAGKERTWNFSDSDADGYFNVNNGGYGQTGCVIFRPENASISAGDTYLVTIWQGDTVIANYTVNFF